MTIIRVDKRAGHWEAVPVAMMNDARMSLEARGLAAWFVTRPPNWRIQVGALAGLLGVGREKVKRVLGELEAAGYLLRSRSHDVDGRWVWESTFTPFPAIDGFPVDGESVDGSPAGGRAGDGTTDPGRAADGQAVGGSAMNGKAVDIRKTRGTTRTRTTTEAPPGRAGRTSLEPLEMPEVLSRGSREACVHLLSTCPPELKQAVLDEIAGLAGAGRIRGSPTALLHSLVQSAYRGTFTPSAGIAISRQRTAKSTPAVPLLAPEPEPPRNDAQREEGRRQLAVVRNNLAASVHGRSQRGPQR